jgi:short-subunit dehydrogenase
MKRRFPDAPHVLITGTSGAIGSAIARELRARRPRSRLTLVDRLGAPTEELRAELGERARTRIVDLAQHDAIPSLVDDASRDFGPIDGLVNAAGLMEVRRFESMPWELIWRLLAVDLVAPLRLASACLGAMPETAGFIVNVSSMAGRVPLKGCSVYGAAKAGLGMASEILHVELRRRRVHVITVYPGPVASGLERSARAQFNGSRLAHAIPTGQPRALARRVLDAVERGLPRVVYPSWYAVGFEAVALASRAALRFGPEPRA